MYKHQIPGIFLTSTLLVACATSDSGAGGDIESVCVHDGWYELMEKRIDEIAARAPETELTDTEIQTLQAVFLEKPLVEHELLRRCKIKASKLEQRADEQLKLRRDVVHDYFLSVYCSDECSTISEEGRDVVSQVSVCETERVALELMNYLKLEKTCEPPY
ncbi:MAG: hypothetical protein KDJ38_09120 [Gammaproteobacteria bacterium]|nr:hypothetical protein [Gammaproteobacteria bacterium]